MTWLGIDGGQSAVRLRRSWAPDRIRTGAGYRHRPSRPGEHNGVDGLLADLAPLIAEARAESPIDVVAAGLTGFPADPEDRALLADGLIALSGAADVRLCGDVVTAHLGALGGGPGVVVSAGTGVVALGLTEDGAHHRVDGWGHLFGDAGGAFAIGRAGLAAALRDLDGRARAPRLAAAARAYFGPDLSVASWRLYADPDRVDRVARFAPGVLALVDAGDPAARAILSEAADNLVDTIDAAARPFGTHRPVTVAMVGRLVDPGSVVANAVAAHPRAATFTVVPARGDPLDGASRLAAHEPGVHRDLVHRYGA